MNHTIYYGKVTTVSFTFNLTITKVIDRKINVKKFSNLWNICLSDLRTYIITIR